MLLAVNGIHSSWAPARSQALPADRPGCAPDNDVRKHVKSCLWVCVGWARGMGGVVLVVQLASWCVV